MNLRKIGTEIEHDAEEISDRTGIPAPALIVGAGLLIFYFATRNLTAQKAAVAAQTARVAADTAANSGTGGGSGTGSGSGGTSTPVADPTASLSSLFRTGITNLAHLTAAGFTAQADAMTHLSSDVSGQIAASSAATKTLGDNLTGAQGQTNTLVQGLFADLKATIAAQGQAQTTAANAAQASNDAQTSTLGNAIASQAKNIIDTITGGQTQTAASIADVKAFIDNRTSTIGGAINSGNAAVAAKIDAGNTLHIAQLTALGDRISQMFAPVTATLNSLNTDLSIVKTGTTKADRVSSYQLGAHGAAACYDNGGISVQCIEDQGRSEVGRNDTNQNAVRTYLTNTYGPCLKNGRYDPICVGDIIKKNNGIE